MINKQLGIKLSTLTLALLLAGCGGSDGYYNQGPGSTTKPTNPGTGEEVKAVNIGAIQLYDLNGNPTNIVTVDGVTAKVKVTDQAGHGIGGVLVAFNASGGVVLGSSNGAVLSNADGEASISIAPENINTTGAYSLSATATYDDISASAKAFPFSLQSLSIILTDMQAASATLESGGSTNISLKTQNLSSRLNQNNVAVSFGTSCGTFEPVNVVSSNQGNVVTSYKAIASTGELCEGEHTIWASGQNIPRSEIRVNIAKISADSLVYTTSTPINLGIKSSGSASSGQVEFTLYANGIPAKDKEVLLELRKAPEDLNFIFLGNRDAKTVKSDPNGKVRVNLYPGNKPGPVEIKASLVSNPSITGLSKDVAVSIGRVTQKGLSLSISKQALRTDIDGDVATIVARMADRVGNPVPEGTVISFVSEGGKVEPNCAADKNGECSVNLITQNPRPTNNRVTVLAYLEGDKDYRDMDGDNLYTEGVDILTDNIGDFFRDDNEDNIYNAGEFIYKKAAGTLACAASRIEQPNIPDTCDNGLSAVLRQQILFVFAHDTPTFIWNAGFNAGKIASGNGIFSFQVFGNNLRTVPMPSGTTVSVEVKDNTENNQTCEAEIITGDVPVPNKIDLLTPASFGSSANAAVSYTVRLKGCAAGDDIRVITSVPGGKTSRAWLEIK